jgi:hypothetical protein
MLVNSALQSSVKTISDIYFDEDESIMNPNYKYETKLKSATAYTTELQNACKEGSLKCI